MRILGWIGSLLVIIGFVGCGPANSLEEGIPEDAPYVPAPKIEFAKPKSRSSTTTKPSTPAKPEAKKQ